MEVHRDDYYRVVEEEGFTRLERLAAPFPSIVMMRESNDALVDILSKRSTRRLLMDMRSGPIGRNDPEFEQANEEMRLRLSRMLERVAVLVGTAAGRLQVSRLMRQTGVAPSVYMDEAQAIAWLRS